MAFLDQNSCFRLLLAVVVIGLGACGQLRTDFPCPTGEGNALGQSSITPVGVSQRQEDFRWQNVNIRGMGFVTGVVIHPRVPELVYVRTDVGGIYRWQEQTRRWVQLLDGQRGLYRVESIALDPQRPEVLYAAAEGVILRSGNRGQSWQATPLLTPTGKLVYMNGNGEWRWVGERLAVDPNNSQTLYFGSRQDGLYRSNDGGESWQVVKTFPTSGVAPGGIAFVVFDPTSGAAAQPSQTIYAGVIGAGVYRSQDGGQSWSLLTGGAVAGQQPQQAVVTAAGTLYVTFFSPGAETSGGVWQYNEAGWQEITPRLGHNYSAIASAPTDPDTLVVAEYPLTPEGLHHSTNGGQTWGTVALQTWPVPWWPDWHLYTLTGGLAISPSRPEQAWLTTGFGVLRTDDITQRPSQWCAEMNNLEELVVFVLKSPPVPGGAALLSGVADMHGFRHKTVTTIPSTTHEGGSFGDTTGLDFSEADPNIIVRVGSAPSGSDRTDSSETRAAYSDDNGRTWQPFAQPPPGAVNGKVAVSATLQSNGYPVIVWAPQGDAYPYRSVDGGRTWQLVIGAPNRTTLQLWFPSQAIASDRVDGNLFYLYKYTETAHRARFYRSNDGGQIWQPVAWNLPDSYQHAVKAVPGRRGNVWLRAAGQLLGSRDAGNSFTPIAQVDHVNEFTFGKPAPGQSQPTVFVSGRINGVEGLFRSDDALAQAGNAATATWIKLSTTDQTLSNVTYLEGDRRLFGRVYVGTGGRGILYNHPDR